ncbi:MAG: hypothetical protein K8R21_13630 [Leptospira sp.]|nr:hypothetical protein [Leptospira sp.]
MKKKFNSMLNGSRKDAKAPRINEYKIINFHYRQLSQNLRQRYAKVALVTNFKIRYFASLRLCASFVVSLCDPFQYKLYSFLLIPGYFLISSSFSSCKGNQNELQKKNAAAGNLYSLQKTDEALKIYEEILKEEKSVHALIMAGKIQYYKKKYTVSGEYFSQAMDNDKGNLLAEYWLAKVESQTPENEEEAIKKINRILERNVSTIDVAYLKGTILERKGNIREAIQSYNQAIREEEKIALAYLRMARLYKITNMKDMSGKFLAKAKMLSGSNQEMQKVIRKQMDKENIHFSE